MLLRSIIIKAAGIVEGMLLTCMIAVKLMLSVFWLQDPIFSNYSLPEHTPG